MTGTLNSYDERVANTARRFWLKVDAVGGCWVWQGARGGSLGYGQVRGITGETEFAHRVAWQLENGPIPKGVNVLHRCDVPLCVRPAHLYLGTAQDNADDQWIGAPLMVRKPRGAMPAKDVIVSVRVAAADVEGLNRLCEADKLTRSEVIRRAIRLCVAGRRGA